MQTQIGRYITSGLSSCPSQKYALLGYSQGAVLLSLVFDSLLTLIKFGERVGAAATTDYLKTVSTTSAAGQAIKAVFVIGNPERLPGKQSNVDQTGGQLTATAIGLEGTLANAGIPSSWDTSGKILDVCYVVNIFV